MYCCYFFSCLVLVPWIKMEKSPNLKGYISTVRIFNDINSLEPKFKKKEKNRRNVFICLGLTRNMKNIEKKTTLTSAGRKDKHKKFFSNYFFFFSFIRFIFHVFVIFIFICCWLRILFLWVWFLRAHRQSWGGLFLCSL